MAFTVPRVEEPHSEELNNAMPPENSTQGRDRGGGGGCESLWHVGLMRPVKPGEIRFPPREH